MIKQKNEDELDRTEDTLEGNGNELLASEESIFGQYLYLALH